jgi:SAM-dependent methyltransferase
MAQITSGLRRLLGHPQVYRLSQQLIASDRRTAEWVATYVRPGEHARILDIGCGPADLLQFLPAGVTYVGFDLSADYVTAAKARWGSRGTFVCERVDDAALKTLGEFDLVIARGVLHHLDDSEARALFALASRALTKSGRLVALDPCFEKGQSPIARWLIQNDRGQNVRTAPAYRALGDGCFDAVVVGTRHDLNRLPYTHCVLEAQGPRMAT